MRAWEVDGPIDVVDRQRQRILERQSLIEDESTKRGWGVPK
jgi:hypothetical protein